MSLIAETVVEGENRLHHLRGRQGLCALHGCSPRGGSGRHKHRQGGNSDGSTEVMASGAEEMTSGVKEADGDAASLKS